MLLAQTYDMTKALHHAGSMFVAVAVFFSLRPYSTCRIHFLSSFLSCHLYIHSCYDHMALGFRAKRSSLLLIITFISPFSLVPNPHLRQPPLSGLGLPRLEEQREAAWPPCG